MKTQRIIIVFSQHHNIIAKSNIVQIHEDKRKFTCCKQTRVDNYDYQNVNFQRNIDLQFLQLKNDNKEKSTSGLFYTLLSKYLILFANTRSNNDE